MKIKRILSSALVLLMLFTTVVAAIPASAAPTDSVTVTVNTPKDGTPAAKDILTTYKNEYKFSSAEEMLNHELSLGYLDWVEAGEYRLYINRYTGIVYYRNMISGQTLVSNPYNPNANQQIKTFEGSFSQLEIEYFSITDTSESTPVFYSSQWIGEGFDIVLTELEDGIRVSYSLGFRIEDFLTAGAIMADDFMDKIADPMFEKLAELLTTYCGPYDGIREFDKPTVNGQTLSSYNLGSASNKRLLYRTGTSSECYDGSNVWQALNSLQAIVDSKLAVGSNEKKIIQDYINNINNIFEAYSLNDPAFKLFADGTPMPDAETTYQLWYDQVPGMEEGGAAYVIKEENLVNYRLINTAIRNNLGNSFTKDDRDAMLNKSQYVPSLSTSPWVNCAIEYTLDTDGALYVSIPTESISYNEENYAITSITPIKHFGTGVMDGEGYIFVPDGSGAIVDFEDIVDNNVNIYAQVYGQDACYAYVGDGKPNERVTMPVYGIVSQVEAGDTTSDAYGVDSVTNGFFAIIESGATFANISAISNLNTRYVYTYSSYSPYPNDKYDLSDTLSVSGLSFYNVVADTHFEGECKTRITMLTDDTVAEKRGLTSYYPASYVGMAACYKDYLKAKGVLGDIIDAADDIPLYIEALGSIDIIEKIMTFPVTVSSPLTTFEDVEMMYNQFSDAVNVLKAKAQEQRDLADALLADEGTKEDARIKVYQKKAAEYDALAAKVENIVNVNFRLTGFANGGVYFTYPAKLHWESSVGGKRGFKDLIAATKEVNKNSDKNFTVYPDFDFLYINNTEAFDGIGLNRSAARLVDNRYASKQVWNSLVGKSGMFEPTFSLLVSPDELDRLYEKFNKKYSKLGADTLSVATLGSDVNSNFNEDNPYNREQSLGYITALLDKMANENGYTLMTDVGNVYAVEYVDHILNATVDSTHLKNASYTVPFYGMVLHGYVSYTGTAFNYSGSPDYDMLRAIENGASLYYILCCRNTNNLKEDETLSKYYGIDYNNWFEKIAVQYKTLNDAISDLQEYEIVYHSPIIAERVIDSDETAANYRRLADEYVEQFDVLLQAKLDAALAALRADPAYSGLVGQPVHIVIDRASLVSQMCEMVNLTAAELDELGFGAAVDAVIAKYDADYAVYTDGNTALVAQPNWLGFSAADMVYTTKYDYVTDSLANAKDYDVTDFTCDNANVVMVTYKDAVTGDEVTFLLNYNVFSVEVKVDNTIDKTLADGEVKTYPVGSLDFVRLPNTVNP